MSGQRIERYFSVYSLYSFASGQDSGLQIVGYMQRENGYTNQCSPIHDLADT